MVEAWSQPPAHYPPVQEALRGFSVMRSGLPSHPILREEGKGTEWGRPVLWLRAAPQGLWNICVVLFSLSVTNLDLAEEIPATNAQSGGAL